MAFDNDKIDFIWGTVATQVIGDDKSVKSLRLKSLKDGRTSLFPVDGVFIYIGHEPNTGMFGEQLEVDENGFVLSDSRQRTNVEGVFIAGDIQAPLHRQAVVAAGTGAIAAIEAERYVAALEGRSYPGGDLSKA
jgi:thioredoxin reductase (NADPH)